MELDVLSPIFSDGHTQNYNPPQADPNICNVFQVPWTDVETRQQPLPAPTIVARDADNVPAATDISEPSTGHSQDGSMQQTNAPTAPAPDTEIEVEDTASPAATDISEPSTGHSQDGSMQQTNAPTAPAPDTEIEVEDTASPATRTLSGRVIKQNQCFFDSKVQYAFNAFLRTYEPTDVATRQQPLLAPAVAGRGADNIPAATVLPESSRRHSQGDSTQQTDAPIAPILDTEPDVEETGSPSMQTQSEHVVRQNCCFFNLKIPMALTAQYIFGNVASSRNPTFSDNMTWRQTPQPVDPTIEDMFRVSWTKPTHRDGQPTSTTMPVEGSTAPMPAFDPIPETGGRYIFHVTTQWQNITPTSTPNTDSSAEDTNLPATKIHSGCIICQNPRSFDLKQHASNAFLHTFSSTPPTTMEQNHNPPQADPNVRDMFQVPWMDAATQQQPLPAPTLAVCNADDILITADIPGLSTAPVSENPRFQNHKMCLTHSFGPMNHLVPSLMNFYNQVKAFLAHLIDSTFLRELQREHLREIPDDHDIESCGISLWLAELPYGS